MHTRIHTYICRYIDRSTLFSLQNTSIFSLTKILIHFSETKAYYMYFPLEYRAHGFTQDTKSKTQAIPLSHKQTTIKGTNKMNHGDLAQKSL